jgi:hypothetical protein
MASKAIKWVGEKLNGDFNPLAAVFFLWGY